MSPTFAIAPTQEKASKTLLTERLAQLEATLLEARGRVLRSFDTELAALRGWMDSLEHFDPTVGLQTLDEPVLAQSSFEELIAEPPCAAPRNIVPFRPSSTHSGGPVQEQPLDPALASATIDELNAALTAAFQHMAKDPLPHARSA